MTPEDDLAAAEFALGTLSPGERAELAARRLREPEIDAGIRQWEERLQPLAEAAAPIEPPGDAFARIEARIRGAVAQLSVPLENAAMVSVRRSMARWRAAAIAASAIAAILAIGFALRETTRGPAAPREYVAILQKDPASPAFEVTVNLDRQELTVRPVAAQAPPGKAYELWLINAKLGAPRSLGVIGDSSRPASLASYDRALVEDATYAVTIEPPGGSPTGQPSGPPAFFGKLIPIGP
jgi:anti-sigma-K factor RskA